MPCSVLLHRLNVVELMRMESSMEMISRESLTILMELQYQWKTNVGGDGLYRSRGHRLTGLSRLSNATTDPPLGLYRCEIPDGGNGVSQNIYINIGKFFHTHTHTYTHTNTHLQSCVSFAHTNYHPTANISLFHLVKILLDHEYLD